ncbi:nickel-dependent hydrogenase large subunit [Skermanella mucosa]|uniref:nickel-dependent hydrogenase large subunit n=1 Tax=Skermanella mucosa TaxID=1789672 RepID=UPI00192AD0D0|nr:nickel-dependent hydrogenase large subunit [Skermanella mucosa]UEM19390.1 nickel-dependent hydrogenase large subunit [Skermanella mucosa]
MNARAGIEGTLSFQIMVIDSTVADVRLKSSRGTGIDRMLAGRPVADALSLVPMLFSLCGTAQGVAAARACEAAAGIVPAGAHQAAREILILGEMVASHAWQLAIEWPRLMEEAPDPGILLGIRRRVSALAESLYPARDWTRPGGGALKPDAIALDDALDHIAGAVEALVGAGFEEIRDGEDLARWSRRTGTTAARLISRVMADDMAGFGRSGVARLPGLPDRWFADRLSADPGFATAPDLDGGPAETGALGRAAGTPLMVALTGCFGNGLLPRFAARLVDLSGLPARMRDAARLLEAVRPAPPDSVQGITGSGAGSAETARGRLAHWIALNRGAVTTYRSVAPNEWNFHPRGAFVRGLVGLPADDGLRRRVDLLIAALDPCVPCHVMMEERAGA